MTDEATHAIEPMIAELARIGKRKKFTRRSMLIREGDPGGEMFVLLSGRIRIFTEGEGRRRFVFGTFGPGTPFGEFSLDHGPRTASVEAIADCECAIIDYAALKEKLTNDPMFAMALMSDLITRSRASTERLKSLALDTVYQRLRKFIAVEAQPDGESLMLGPEWSQQEIANRLGSSRDMITRIFRDLSKGGYITTKRGETRILKPLPKGW